MEEARIAVLVALLVWPAWRPSCPSPRPGQPGVLVRLLAVKQVTKVVVAAADLHGIAFGMTGTVDGVGVVASVAAGALWATAGPALAFGSAPAAILAGAVP